MFLDIETTGLSRYYDTITLVGWSMGGEYNLYIKGDDPAPLRHALTEAKAIVTFNGSLFDLPFLHYEFSDLQLPAAHVDLRFLAKRVGLAGGQKDVELKIGLERPGVLSQLRGEAAPLLWHKYRRGDLDCLKLLVSYNFADIEGMKFVLDTAVERLLELDQFPKQIGRQHRFFGGYSQLAVEALFDRLDLYKRQYKGTSGPLISIRDLKVPESRIVGIDLTGSEIRPSGWCLLENGIATTQRIGSDQALIAATMTAKPTLVSIDSPLSLPRGRADVEDSDPGRVEYGIMRECERILKKRGVNVYPSLIRSMQALTARGIRLANHLRSVGVPVIESYPGAAQDIMNIPRKRADLALLKQGLVEFGIYGDFETEEVSHDELDAITSAAVGLFFISGKFEALGNETEDYLIIPDVRPKRNAWGKRRVIGLSGPISSGKTTAGKYIESLQFSYGRYSQVLKALLKEKGLQVSRDSLQQIGEEIYEGRGQRWLGSELLKCMPESGNLVIDGLRHPEDYSFLVERFGPDFLHAYIEAPEETRMERYVANGKTKDEFIKASAHIVESNIPKLSELAHIVIHNDGTLDEFFSKLHETVNTTKNPETEGESVCR
jgi:predicted nuclease with RNAse H fold/dephospho-CoA kinase